MTQEEKNMLLKDLCGRLPYGVMVQVNDAVRGIYDRRLVQVFCDRVSCSVNVCNPLKECICIDSVRPYLHRMSTMTEEEEAVLVNKQGYERYEWLDRKMFDYRGLIPRGLALETPEETYEHEAKADVNESGSRIEVGCKIRSKENPDIILSIISDDCHGDEFECSNGIVLSLKQIKKHYDLYIEENKGTIVIN
jgi:hypothetical protein